MPIHDSESVKFTFDHIKSVWTLSAGGFAAAIGLFAYIVKEAHFSVALNISFGLGSLIAVALFIFSIWQGVNAQKNLINEVSESEANAADSLSPKLVRLNTIARCSFFFGCIAIAATALALLFVSACKAGREAGLTISLKNPMLQTKDSRIISIEDLDIRIPESTFAVQPDKSIDIRDVTFRERAFAEKQ